MLHLFLFYRQRNMEVDTKDMKEDSGPLVEAPTSSPPLANPDVLRVMLRYVAHTDFLFFALVSRDWREAWGERPTITTIIPTPASSVSQLRYGFECGSLTDGTQVCTAAARLGSFELLRCARDHGCAWDADTCAAAAREGHQDVLEHLRLHLCPWDKTTCAAAAEGGHLAVLKWAMMHDCPWSPRVGTAAARNGDTTTLRWARMQGCPWDEEAPSAAARSGHLETLKWLREQGCPWDHRTCSDHGMFSKFLTSYRSEQHGAVRTALTENILLPALAQESALNKGAETPADLIRGVRQKLFMMDQAEGQATFARTIKAHRAKDRAGLEVADIFGDNLLLQDFTTTVAIPLGLMAVAECEHQTPVALGSPETIICSAQRIVRSWSKLQNGGYSQRAQRAFQDAMWRNLFNFVTGPRQIAHGLMNMQPSAISADDAHRFLAPYSVAGEASTMGARDENEDETLDAPAALPVEETAANRENTAGAHVRKMFMSPFSVG